MAARSPYVPLASGGHARLWKQPGEAWRRLRSNAAFVSDFLARHKPLMLCAGCEQKMPGTWMSRYGYRLLRQFHGDGHCDYCKGFASCNIFHHEAEAYCQEWDRLARIEAAIAAQRVTIRDKRRIH